MLEGDRDTGLAHPGEEGSTVAPGRRRIMAILTLERTDRLVLRVRPRRDHVHHRREVEVDTGSAELLRPASGATLQEGGIPGPLHDRGWNLGKTGALHRLDHAAFLIGRHEETYVARRPARHLCLDCRRDSCDAGDPCVARFDKPDGADENRLDQVDLGVAKAVARETELEELTDPLIECEGREDPVGAGKLWSRRSWGWRRRRGGGDRRTGRWLWRASHRGPTGRNGHKD